MGSWGGHVVPGVFFLLYGLSFCACVSAIDFSKRRNQRRALLPSSAGVIMIVLGVIGSIIELYWPGNAQGLLRDPVTHEFWSGNNWQHFTMYADFVMTGFFIVLVSRGPRFIKGIDRLSGALAFFIEGFLFQNHVHGRSEIDKLIHILIVVICYASASFFLVSFFVKCRRRLYLIDMVTGILVFAQGTWFIHVAEIIYGKHAWPGVLDTEEHEDHGKEAHGDMMEDGHHEEGHMGMDSSEHMNMMFAVIFFAWHIVFAIIVNSLIAFGIYKLLKKKEILDLDFINDSVSDPENNNSYAGMNGKSKNVQYESLNMSDKSPLLNGEDDDEEETDIFARA